ncbi:MAG TPA: hypothetical protein VFE05_23970, partial [Longimicrobiaceae bacterium]|nr:hypothetical protein [Longimicrobiaceae bacterium]
MARAVFCAGAAAVLAGGRLAAQGGDVQEAPVVACRADELSVPFAGSTHLRIFTDVADAPRFVWSSAAGTITGDGAGAEWSLASALPGVYEATARAAGADSARFTPCTVQVVVSAREEIGDPRPGQAIGSELRGSPLSAAGQLVGAAHEGTRFGLYSYVLFRAPPNDATRERYQAVAAEYLRQMPGVDALLEYRPPEEMNVTYVPVVRRLRQPT